MHRPLIGIPMWNQGENSVGATKPYLEYFKNYGEIILLAPTTFIPNLDLLVLPGGKDIANGNPNDFSFHNSDNERFLEHFDKFTLPHYINELTPIFAICRGMQAIMRHFEIPLIQDIWWDHGYSKDENDSKPNTLTFTKYFEMSQGKDAVKTVGSWHHQGVSVKDVEEQGDFDVIAHTKDGTELKEYHIVEYLEHKNLPIKCVQSHPERNKNKLDKFLIKNLLNKN